MEETFKFLKQLSKISAVDVDTFAFRLHYKYTVCVLAVFFIIVSSKQYVGDPIDCVSLWDEDETSNEFVNLFCWIHHTFSVENAWEKEIGVEVPYPGVDTYTKDDKKIVHAYYQWVCLVLFFQAILFYIPKYLWKSCERGLIQHLVLGIKSPVLPKAERDKNREILVEYMVQRLGNHFWYGVQFVLCEALNFINVVGQQIFLDKFLNNEFSTYGLKVLFFTEWDWSLRFDPMIKIFPRVTKCLFHRYGPSGDIEKLDTLCLLPINVVNEKIFIVLWFWFCILSILTCLTIMFHIFTLVSYKVRYIVLKCLFHSKYRDYLDVVLRHCNYSDWLVLYFLSKNLDHLIFCDLIYEISKKLQHKNIKVRASQFSRQDRGGGEFDI